MIEVTWARQGLVKFLIYSRCHCSYFCIIWLGIWHFNSSVNYIYIYSFCWVRNVLFYFQLQLDRYRARTISFENNTREWRAIFPVEKKISTILFSSLGLSLNHRKRANKRMVWVWIGMKHKCSISGPWGAKNRRVCQFSVRQESWKVKGRTNSKVFASKMTNVVWALRYTEQSNLTLVANY